MNLFDLTGKKALVTGAGSPEGLGRAMAQALKEAGAQVVVLSRSKRIFEIAEKDGFFAIQADLADRAELKRGFSEAVGHLGTMDILINSHGFTHLHEAKTFPIEDWDRMLETNLTSHIVVSVNLDFLNRASANDTFTNAQSRKWQLPAAISSNEAPAKSIPSYCSSGSSSPSWGVSSPTLPAMG